MPHIGSFAMPVITINAYIITRLYKCKILYYYFHHSSYDHMPVSLDKIDVSIIKSILKDGRKPFRQISRETEITTPTVIAIYERLVNIRFIKAFCQYLILEN